MVSFYLLLNDIKVVPVIPLLDDIVSFGDIPLEHGVNNVAELLRLQGFEQEDPLHCVQETCSLVVGFGMNNLING